MQDSEKRKASGSSCTMQGLKKCRTEEICALLLWFETTLWASHQNATGKQQQSSSVFCVHKQKISDREIGKGSDNCARSEEMGITREVVKASSRWGHCWGHVAKSWMA